MSLTQTQAFLDWLHGSAPEVAAAIDKRFPDWAKKREIADRAIILLAVWVFDYKPNPMDYPDDRRHHFILPDMEKNRHNLSTFGFTEKSLCAFQEHIRASPILKDKTALRGALLAAGLDPDALKFCALKDVPSAETRATPEFGSW
jgi:hypothetical protein